MNNPSEFVWTPERVEAFWNFESRYPKRYFTYHYGVEMVRQLGPFLPRDGSILDYGCGAGHMLRELVERGYRTGGTDSSDRALERVNAELGGRGNFLGAYRPEVLQEQGRRFDAVLVLEVVEHLYDDGLDWLLDTVQRLVTAQGHIVFTTPNEERLEDSQLLCPCCDQVFHRWQHVRSWSKTSLCDYLQGCGMSVTEAFTTDFRLSFHKKGQRWWSLRKALSYRLRPHKAGPNLVVVCRPNA